MSIRKLKSKKYGYIYQVDMRYKIHMELHSVIQKVDLERKKKLEIMKRVLLKNQMQRY